MYVSCQNAPIFHVFFHFIHNQTVKHITYAHEKWVLTVIWNISKISRYDYLCTYDHRPQVVGGFSLGEFKVSCVIYIIQNTKLLRYIDSTTG